MKRSFDCMKEVQYVSERPTPAKERATKASMFLPYQRNAIHFESLQSNGTRKDAVERVKLILFTKPIS